MDLSFTPTALERVRHFLVAHPDKAGLRFGVRRSGCSGWGYVVDFADVVTDADTVIDVDGVHVIVDELSLPLVRGTRIDFVKHGLNAQFTFDNPNATDGCGCGESFTTAADRAA
ncbi:MAG: iron-sulfur cluster assembly accessory protein [Proteobacteria bacterium]|nr:iron-sulfur cluster assembly accessory protein [Pseudomonadota bacterium]